MTYPTEPYAAERQLDRFGVYEQRWWCPLPPAGRLYVVTRESWDVEPSPPVRNVFEIELLRTRTDGN
jgi:hypothetical protein